MKIFDQIPHRMRSTLTTFASLDDKLVELQEKGNIIHQVLPHEVENRTTTEYIPCKLGDSEEVEHLPIETSKAYFTHIILYYEPQANKLN